MQGSQSFDPWGKVYAGPTPVTQTKINYTGQKLDDTGLLYMHARYYDPVLGRFTSPDSIVPGASLGVGGAGGTLGAEQNSLLTVDLHETGFLTSVAGENQQILQKGFWFQLGGQDRARTNPFGPIDPQALARYPYALNNPLRYIDPTGHLVLTAREAGAFFQILGVAIEALKSGGNFWNALAKYAKDIAVDYLGGQLAKGVLDLVLKVHAGDLPESALGTTFAQFIDNFLGAVDNVIDCATNGCRDMYAKFLGDLQTKVGYFLAEYALSGGYPESDKLVLYIQGGVELTQEGRSKIDLS